MLHLNWLLLELTCFDPVNLRATLIPLERMKSLEKVWTEAVFDIVIHAQVSVDDVIEIINNLVCILIEQPLELGHFFIVIEVLFILSIQLSEDLIVVLQGVDQLFGSLLLREVRSLLQLAVLLDKSLIELGQFGFHVLLDVLLLVPNDLENFILELDLSLFHEIFEFFKH
jgi:hypothetical protein